MSNRPEMGNAYRILFYGAAALLVAGFAFLVRKGETAPGWVFSIGFTLYAIILFALLLVAVVRNTKRAVFGYMALLLVGAFVLYTYLSIHMPFNDGPDEPMRYDVVRYIVQHGTLPRGDDPEIINSMWGFSYAFYPILPYIIGGFAGRLFMPSGAGFVQWVLCARMVSILSTMGTIVISYFIGRERLRTNGARLALPLFVAFFPGLICISTYVTVESFAIMASSLVILAWIRGLDHGWRTKDMILLCVGMALVMLSYYNSCGYVLLSIPFFLISAASHGQKGSMIAKKAIGVTVFTFLLAGWWFIRNGILYHGDVIGRRALSACQELHMDDNVRALLLKTPKNLGLSLSEMFYDMQYLELVRRSYVGGFSRTFVIYAPVIYTVFRIFFVTAAILVVLRLLAGIMRAVAGKHKTKGEWALYTSLILGAVIPCAIAIWYAYAVDFQPQGRYWMPGFPSVAYLLLWGYEGAGATLGRIGGKHKTFFEDLPGLLVAFFMLCIILIIGNQYLIPYYAERILK